MFPAAGPLLLSVMANATRAGTTLLRSCLCRSAVAVRPFAHLRILYAGPGCKSGPAGFKAGQAFTAVYNRASRLYSRPARFKTGRPTIKPAAGFQAGQVYNRALTYIYIYIMGLIWYVIITSEMLSIVGQRKQPHSCKSLP